MMKIGCCLKIDAMVPLYIIQAFYGRLPKDCEITQMNRVLEASRISNLKWIMVGLNVCGSQAIGCSTIQKLIEPVLAVLQHSLIFFFLFLRRKYHLKLSLNLNKLNFYPFEYLLQRQKTCQRAICNLGSVTVQIILTMK